VIAFCNLITELGSWDFESAKVRHGELLQALFSQLVGNFFQGQVISPGAKNADG
jgi:hypothetical protein